jgi:hypothetical protein
MLVRATRWFLIGAPVVGGVLVLIFGTAGSISTSFGIVLIGIGPIIWLWNCFGRMSFDDDDRTSKTAPREELDHEAQRPQRPNGQAVPRHLRRRMTRRLVSAPEAASRA